MSDLPVHVEQNLRRHCHAADFRRVLVAVSGGLDSTVLLHVLSKVSAKFGWRLGVAHVDHGLRGRASLADARRVRSLSQKLKLPVFVARADVTALAKREKLSIEMAARQARHDFLASTATEHGFGAIALAHHADDQVELFFLRLLRGSGVEGLAGMKWNTPSPWAPGIRLLRPLLDLPKAPLRIYAKENALAFAEDATNAAADFLRNRIRLELLPLLRRDYQTGLDQCVLRTMEILAADAAYVNRQARLWLEKRRASSGGGSNLEFPELPLALQRQCLRLQLLDKGHPAEFDLVERLRLEGDRCWEISPGLVACRDANGTVTVEKAELSRFLSDSICLELGPGSGEASFGGLRICWRIGSGGATRPDQLGTNQERFDADAVGCRVVLRHWRPGDRFRPIGGPGEVKLQDIFTNQRVPSTERRKRVVGCAESGEVFWVQGLRIAERFKLTGKTRKYLYWRWDPA